MRMRLLGPRASTPLLLAIFMTSCAIAPPERTAAPVANPLLGTWELVSAQAVRPTGETQPISFLDGAEGAAGVGIYGPDGWMSAHIMGGGERPARPPQQGGFGYSADEAALVVRSYYAYAGEYEVDPAAGVVRHFVRYSLHPVEVGRTYERRFRIDGDTLTLETPPVTVDGERRFNRLVWRRVRQQ